MQRACYFTNIVWQRFQAVLCFCRNATFPQELAFSLDQPARLTQLQVLSHEYKVMRRLQSEACIRNCTAMMCAFRMTEAVAS
jgi:hypothetical protein